LFAALAAQK
jgi:hypothetical protein